MSDFINHERDLAMYFGAIKPVSIQEFYRFWDSLTYTEKLYYRTAQLV